MMAENEQLNEENMSTNLNLPRSKHFLGGRVRLRRRNIAHPCPPSQRNMLALSLEVYSFHTTGCRDWISRQALE